MSKKKIRLVVVCEDVQQQCFAKYYFKACGFNPHRIDFQPVPDGKGSGEQYVRKTYLQWIRTYRSKSTHLTSLRLVIIIDADSKTVEERLNQLDSELQADGQTERQPHEKIAVFIPKRNIETWIYYLMDEPIDELEDYKKKVKKLLKEKPSDCEPFVKKLALEICRKGFPDAAPSSLHAACKELPRVVNE